MAKRHNPTIKELYPDLNDNELMEAEDNLDGYLEVVWSIYQRIRSNPAAYARFKALTDLQEKPYDEDLKVAND